MKRIFTFFFLLIISSASMAQLTGSVKGKLVDSSSSKQSMKDASVAILDPSDSTTEIVGLSIADGSFQLHNLSFGAYLLRITFSGYDAVYKKITISKAAPDLNVGNIYLEQAANDLGNVTVTESAIRMKHDTIEYNASSFKTKPNAVVEDLLKKFPGMDVDKSGTIKAAGETVQRVLVDGKRFFGDDPKMATKNLPPDIVDKIQVFDDLSDQSKFTGFDDGNRVKTINITTKKDKRKGYFGKVVAGIGTVDDGNQLYDENFNLQRMNGDQQISVVGQANNVNKQNFTVQDFLGGGNGGGRGGGGGGGGRGGGGGGGGSTGTGLTSILAGGMNYRNNLSKDVDMTGSYFYNSQHTNTTQSSFTQSILTNDSTTYSNSGSSSERVNENNRINLNFEGKFDSSNSFVFRPNVSFQHASPFSESSTITSYDPVGGKQIYNSTSNNSGVTSGYNINGSNLQLRHRFKKRGRTISLDVNVTDLTNNGQGYNYSVNDFFTPVTKIDTINQHYISTSRNYTVSPTVSYTEPIAKNMMIEFNYNYSTTHNISQNDTYDINRATKGYTIFDSLFSNSYDYTSTSNRGTLNYRIQNSKFNLSMGSGLQFTNQNSLNTTKNIDVKYNYVNFTPTVNFQYTFSRSRNLRINYSGRPGQPSISQLQPLTTTSDSINFLIGNPNLKPQFTHSLRLLYQSFDPLTQRVFLVTLNASTTLNDIQNSVIQHANSSIKTTTYVNLNGTYNVSGYVNYGFALHNPKSNLNFTTNVNYSQAQTLINGLSDYTRNTTLSETVKWTTNLKNNFDMNFSSTTNYYIIRNSLQPTLNSNYYTEVLSAEITGYTNNGWLLATDFDYTYSGNHAAGYNTSVPLLNPSIAKLFLKDKLGELRLTVFDLLNQNKSVTRTAQGNTITDQRTNVLTRYAMLTFTYNLRKFAGKQQRMPGLFKGMRGNGIPGGNGGMRMGGGGGGRRN